MILLKPSYRFNSLASVFFCIALAACSPAKEHEKKNQLTDDSDRPVISSSAIPDSVSTSTAKGSLPSGRDQFTQIEYKTSSSEQRKLEVGTIKLPKLRSADIVVEELDEIIRYFGEKVATERDAVRLTMNELGYQPLNSFSDGVSGRAQLEFAMKRAEVGSNYNNGAKDLLIYFRDKFQAESVAMQIDPVLQGLGNATRRTFVFSNDVQAARNVKLESLGLEKAVTKFSKYQPSYFEMKAHAIRCCLRKTSSKKLEEILLSSKNHKEFFTTLLNVEAPPPTQKEKMRVFARGYQAESIARQIDPSLNKIIDSLEEPLPERYRIIKNASDDSVPTFALQKDAIREVAEQAASAGNSQVANFLQNTHLGGNSNDFDANAESVRNSAKAFTPSAAINVTAVASRSSVAAVKAFDRFVQRTFEGSNSISKKFKSASRSIRGPGGISFGAEIIDSPNKLPQKVAWISHSRSPEFGYFLFKLGENNSVTARSKWMYAESAAAAWIALFNPISRRAAFKEDEVFTVVTIDRFYEGELAENQRPVAVNPALMGYQLAWSSARVDFWFSTGKAVRNDILSLHCPTQMDQCQAISEEPNDEAWAAVRQLSTWQFHDKPHRIRLAPPEGSQQIGTLAVCSKDQPECLDSEIPSPHMTISPFAREDLLKTQILQELVNMSSPDCEQVTSEQAFFECLLPELKSSISMIVLLTPTEEKTPEIVALREFQSRLEAIRSGSGLASWLETEMNTDPQPRDELAQKIQPLIDWLIAYHPDFIRLNDFAEAFTLLRWAKDKGILGDEVSGLTAELAPAIYPVPTIIELYPDGIKAKVN